MPSSIALTTIRHFRGPIIAQIGGVSSPTAMVRAAGLRAARGREHSGSARRAAVRLLMPSRMATLSPITIAGGSLRGDKAGLGRPITVIHGSRRPTAKERRTEIAQGRRTTAIADGATTSRRGTPAAILGLPQNGGRLGVVAVITGTIGRAKPVIRVAHFVSRRVFGATGAVLSRTFLAVIVVADTTDVGGDTIAVTVMGATGQAAPFSR